MKIILLSAVLIGFVAAQGGRLDNRCPINEDSRRPTQLPHPTDCGQFLKCMNGRTYELRCPSGQHWNSRSNTCDTVANARCTVQVAPQPPQPPIRPQTPIVRPNPQPPRHQQVEHPDYLNCPNVDHPGRIVYYPYHLNCDQFYQCVNGRAVL